MDPFFATSSSFSGRPTARSPAQLAAIAKRQRNASESLILRVLPEDVIVQCFLALGLKERVRASCISYAWRVLALSHPTIWSALEFPIITTPFDIEMLAAILRRSGGALLDLKIEIPSAYSRPLLDVILGHVSRIRDLKIGTPYFEATPGANPIDLTHVSAPMLQVLSVDNLLGLPNAPLLRVLDVDTLYIAPTFHRVFPRLTECDVGSQYPRYTLDASRFYEFFPNVQQLTIWANGPVTLPAAPVPGTLQHVELHVPGHTLENYLHIYYGHKSLRSFTVYSSLCIPMAIDLFFGIRPDQSCIFKCRVYDDNLDLVADDDFRVGIIINDLEWADLYSESNHPRLNEHFEDIQELEIGSFYLFNEILKSNAEFPSLQTLELVCKPSESTPLGSEVGDGAVLDIPMLRVLILRFEGISESTDHEMSFVRGVLKAFADVWDSHISPLEDRLDAFIVLGAPEVGPQDLNEGITSRCYTVYNGSTRLFDSD